MANKIEIGINQRIPISLLEMALLATLEGQGTPEYFAELASTEYQGENRIRKSTYVMGRLTNRNPLMPFLQENKDYNGPAGIQAVREVWLQPKPAKCHELRHPDAYRGRFLPPSLPWLL